MHSDHNPALNQLPATHVPVERLPCQAGPFSMSYRFDLQILKTSLKTVGLLNLPLLLKTGEGAYSIVSGYRRISALREMGSREIPARVLEEYQISSLDALLINFYDNLATREFNPVEKGMILGRLAKYLSKNQLLDHYMPLLKLPARMATLKHFISFDRDLDEATKMSLIEGRISESTAVALLMLSKKERAAVATLFEKIPFNRNQQKQLLELLSDICRIMEIPIDEMIRTQTFTDILESPCMNRPQMTRALLAFLRAKRFPRLSRAEEVFRKTIARLDLPPEVRINAGPYFESEHYRMEITFRNGLELKSLIDRLAALEPLSRIRDPWEGEGQ
jgi:ParB family chromosome partitioning protein